MADTLAEAIDPLRSDPAHAAVLLDVDGTLAPIVRHAQDAHVPESTRSLLIALSRRYGMVGCVSGRRAADARRVVAIGSIAYVGNHGAEILRPGTVEVEEDEEVATWTRRVQEFATEQDDREARKLRVRLEDKHAIAAFHWRGAPDEREAEAHVREIAGHAEEAGLATHWGRKVLEVRPPKMPDKGTGVERLLRDAGLRTALYAGDDTTDLDGFRALRTLLDDGVLSSVACIGVRSEEAPREISEQADATVQGTAGVRAMLEALL